MRIRTIALNTFGSLLRNKLLLLFLSLFICIVALMMSPLLAYKAVTTAANAEQMQTLVLTEVELITSMVSGFGSLLAAWAAADAVAGEMKSGTILAVMARPLHRWEFLAGKYLGVLMLMAIYVLANLGLSYVLAWLGGENIHGSTWALVVYPLVRYAIYIAISMLLVTLVHPVASMAMVLLLATLTRILSGPSSRLPHWLHMSLYALLPSTALLSEDRFLIINKASLKPFPWSSHLTALAYGIDCAAMFFLLAVWLFHKRSLTRD